MVARHLAGQVGSRSRGLSAECAAAASMEVSYLSQHLDRLGRRLVLLTHVLQVVGRSDQDLILV